jgi:hypothetical protein
MTCPSPWPVFDVAEIAQEASETAGIEFRSGYSLRTARRALELLAIDWSSRGYNLWSVEGPVTVPLQPGQDCYPLPEDTVDIIEFCLRQPSGFGHFTDFAMERFSLPEYVQITNKLAEGRPTILHMRREVHPYFYVWMVPHPGTCFSLVYWRLRRLKSLGYGGTGEPDIPWRFIPAIIAGLAWKMAQKSTDPNAVPRIQMLKQDYEEAFQRAADEDRDRASFRFVPGGYEFI